MSFRYYAQELPIITPTLGASQTDAAICAAFPISAESRLNILVAIKCSSVTAGAGITAKLQSSATGADWQDGNSVSVTGNGWFYIRMNVQNTSDQVKLPLHNIGRIVVTTTAGSAITTDELYVEQAR